MRQTICTVGTLILSLILLLGIGCGNSEKTHSDVNGDAAGEIEIRMEFIPVFNRDYPMSYEDGGADYVKMNESFAEAESLLADQRDMNYSVVTTTSWSRKFPYRDEYDNIWTLKRERVDDHQSNCAVYLLIQGEEIVYEFEAPFQVGGEVIKGFIAEDSNWVLGYCRVTRENNHSQQFQQMVVNGINIGEQKGYDEVYFCGWIEGELFYVFRKGEQYGYVYKDDIIYLGWNRLCDSVSYASSYMYLHPEKRSQGMFFQVQMDGYWGFVVLYSEVVSEDEL